MGTAIGWTDETWNPVTGCTKVSKGCKNCYAERLTERFGRQKFSDVILHPDRLDKPLRWRKPRRIFVNSMSDLFHEDVPDEFITRVFAVALLSPWHIFQVLTKRPRRMVSYFQSAAPVSVMEQGRRWILREEMVSTKEIATYWKGGDTLVKAVRDWPLPNVWLGVSVEDQATADQRIPWLLETPAAVRFVSYEPALGPVDFTRVWEHQPETEFDPAYWLDALRGHWIGPDDLVPRIDWLIAGGESGPKHRPADVAWFQSAADQCAAAGVPFFMKQDSGPRSGKQGRIPDKLWALKQYPKEQ